VTLEEMELSNLEGQLRGGATIVEWMKVAHYGREGRDTRNDWQALKTRVKQYRQVSWFRYHS
jgi:hypothetical protein